jgi:hypothetical protein
MGKNDPKNFAQDGTPQGEDWQSWSAAMYIYAAACIEQKRTPFFDKIRQAGFVAEDEQAD